MLFGITVDEAPIPGGSYQSVINMTLRGDRPNVIPRFGEVVNLVGRPLTPQEDDWLDLLAVIHAADLCCGRGVNEDHVRRIYVSVPVRDPAALEPHLGAIRALFNRLTHDALQIQLSQLANVNARYPTRAEQAPGGLCLVSGGLDSALAALTIDPSVSNYTLLSYRGSGHVQHAQRNVVRRATAQGLPVNHVSFGIDLSHNHPTHPLPMADPSQRSRTLLFCGVAALVAVAQGISDVTLGENGIMAINCPLTPARIGSFSTQTAHPDALMMMGELFSALFGSHVQIVNPLVNLTKADVVSELVSNVGPEIISETHSCWIARRATHCGTCVPCIVRRFGVESAGQMDVPYDVDAFGSPPAEGDEKRGNIADYLMFALTMSQATDQDLLLDFSELTSVSGSSFGDTMIALHRRWAGQVLDVVGRYPALQALA